MPKSTNRKARSAKAPRQASTITRGRERKPVPRGPVARSDLEHDLNQIQRAATFATARARMEKTHGRDPSTALYLRSAARWARRALVAGRADDAVRAWRQLSMANMQNRRPTFQGGGDSNVDLFIMDVLVRLREMLAVAIESAGLDSSRLRALIRRRDDQAWEDADVMLERFEARRDQHRGGSADGGAMSPNGRFTHGADFTWIVVNGKRYDFSKGNQAESIKYLWAEWEKSGLRDGSGLSEKTIGERIGSANERFRLKHVFRTHPAWGTILRPVSKGVFALFFSDSRENHTS